MATSTSADHRIDRELVSSLLAGRSPEDFARLYARHSAEVWRFSLLRAGNEDQAEEVAQEAWVRAVERLERFDGRSSFRTWLLGFVVNCARETGRLRARESLRLVPLPEEEGESPFPDSSSPGSSPGRWAEALDLERAVRVLPDGYRDVLLLHDVLGHTHVEIGAILGIEPGSSKSQLSRARNRLRTILEGDADVRRA